MLCSADGGQPERSDDYTADERRSHDTFIGTDRKALKSGVRGGRVFRATCRAVSSVVADELGR